MVPGRGNRCKLGVRRRWRGITGFAGGSLLGNPVTIRANEVIMGIIRQIRQLNGQECRLNYGGGWVADAITGDYG